MRSGIHSYLNCAKRSPTPYPNTCDNDSNGSRKKEQACFSNSPFGYCNIAQPQMRFVTPFIVQTDKQKISPLEAVFSTFAGNVIASLSH